MNINNAMRSVGEVFSVERGNEMFRAEGIKVHDDREILFKPGTDVRPGDWLRADSGRRFYVHDTDVQMAHRRPFALRALYRTEAEQQAAQETARPQSTTFNIFGPSYGSVIGSQQHAQVLQPTFTFGDLERDIDRLGGEDAEDLKAMVQELRSTLESQDSLSRGKLLEYSDLLNRHGWITGPIAQLLLVYAMSGQIG